MTARTRLLAATRAHRGRIITATLLSIVQALLLLPAPLLLGYAFDTALPDQRKGLIVAIAVGITLVVAASGLAGTASTHLQMGTATRIGQELRTSLYRRIFEAPRDLFDHSLVATLHDRMVQDSMRSIDMYGAVLNRLVPDAIVTVGVAVILVVLEWRLALVTLGAMPLLALVSRVMMARQRPATRRYHGLFRAFSARVMLVLRSQDRVRIAGSEGRELAAAEDELLGLHDARHRLEFITAAHTAAQQAVVGMAGAALLVAGGFMVIDGSMTLGELLAFYAAFALLRTPAGRGAGAYGKVVSGWQAYERVVEFLEDPHEVPYRGTRKVVLDGRLTLSDVTFGYDPDHPVLENFSFSMTPGRVTALVGPNGCGKSTVVNLALGFYRPDSGVVCADGVSYDDVDLHHLRMQLGVVRQELIFLPGTIRENVTYGADPDEATLERALKLSGADSVVESLVHGLDTVVGEDGHLLSGGQRQRLAIARALLGDPRVLILDEPTNHLDEQAIADLLERIGSLRSGVAVLLISHQRAVIQLADDVVELPARRSS